MAKFFVSQDVQFESEVFTRAWFVQSEHLSAAHDLIHPRMMEWLLQSGRLRSRFVIEGRTFYPFIKRRQRVENIDPLVNRLLGFVNQFPVFAWQKARHEYPRPGRGGGFFT